MPSGKTLKLILFEVLEFTALIAPVFVVLERFASLVRELKHGDLTAYWLVVSISIAYVMSVTLLVWAPLEYLVLKRRRIFTEITQWRPTVLAYLGLCTAPCFAIIIAGSKLQVDMGRHLDHFVELPASLLLFSIICVDIVEQLRPCRLMGPADDLDTDVLLPSPLLTHLEPVNTVSGQLHTDEVPTDRESEARNGGPPAVTPSYPPVTPSRSDFSSRAAYLYPSRPRSYSGHLAILWRKDPRAEVFVDSFMFWLDTVEMVRVGGDPDIFYSRWVFPVYILGYVSCLRLVITPKNPLLSWAGVALQDFPFLVLRVALLAKFGFKTPLLYLMKNTLVCLTYVYFTFLTKLKIFSRRSMF